MKGGTRTGEPAPAPVPGAAAGAGLPAMDVAGRMARLSAAIGAAGVEALLVTKGVNIRYLTGFTGSAGYLLVTDGGQLLVTDGRYREQSAEQLSAAGVDARIEISNSDQRSLLGAAVADSRVAGLGFEADNLTWAMHRDLGESWFPDLELIPTSGLVEGLRLVKDEGEVARIQAAAAVADAALAEVRHLLCDHLTERDLALGLDTEMRRLGATGSSFETIVASGPNAAMPHHRPSDRRIGAGDLVVLDFGAVVDGYCSDMTRTVVVGTPSPTQARMLEVVTAAQEAGVAAVRPGATGATVDGACRAVIEDAGWGDAFLHATGHGVGLEIHEAPRVAAGGDATLGAGLVVTVEPGVYLPDHGGVRVEDTVVVTSGGCRVLTLTPKTTAV